MKTLLTILFAFTLSICFAQDSTRVVRVDNAIVRLHIENFTAQYTFPDVIKFMQDANGNWITSVENFQNVRYTGIRDNLRDYLRANGVQTDVRSLKEALETWGQIIDYTPPPDQEESVVEEK